MSRDSGRRIVLVLGGVRSGKSRYAQELAARGSRVAFLATAEAGDDEMRQRIARHREERPAWWTTFEVPIALEDALLQCGAGQFDTILIDCLTVRVLGGAEEFEGYCLGNVLASYIHLSFAANPEAAMQFTRHCRQAKVVAR
jgi:adenosylcobinamide kinase/adenosylcobinamide-phosphate guanylyltransferase